MNVHRLLAIKGKRLLPEASDKCVLPQVLLEETLQHYGGDVGNLPVPLTFSLSSVATGRKTHIGVQEFNAEPGEVTLPAAVLENLGIIASHVDGKQAPLQAHQVDCQLALLSKGEYVLLRPLASGYDLAADWKTALEGAFRGAYTTLTPGDVVRLKDRSERFLVDSIKPDEASICIVDTDLEVDLQPLSDQHAHETLQAQTQPVKLPTTLALDTEYEAHGSGQYIVANWDRTLPLVITVKAAPETDLVVDGQPEPSLDRHIWSDLHGLPLKRIEIAPSNTSISAAETLSICILASDAARSTLTVSQPTAMESMLETHTRCPNCNEPVPKANLFLHERHCARVNKRCGTCGLVITKDASHQHCLVCNAAFSCPQAHHDARWHTPKTCSCTANFANISQLALHRATNCSDRRTVCRFCHLLIQQGDYNTVAFLDRERGLNAHEAECGARTVQCDFRGCGRFIQLKELTSHTRVHATQRATRRSPRICTNTLCVASITDADAERTLGLCTLCFGPLHSTMQDDAARSGLWRRVQRRMLIQLLTGCRRPGCDNSTACATAGVEGDRAAKQAKATTLLAEAKDKGKFLFCVGAAMQTKSVVAEMLAAEGIYAAAWCQRAAEQALAADQAQAPSSGALESVRAWLEREAPTLAESQ